MQGPSWRGAAWPREEESGPGLPSLSPPTQAESLPPSLAQSRSFARQPGELWPVALCSRRSAATMYVCRAAWQALAARLASVSSTATLLRKRAPLRQMSSGSVPGSSGENLIYYLFAGVACTAGGYYAYRTVTSDKKRYNERIHAIQQSNTAEWKPKPWPPQRDELETAEDTEASEQATEAPTEEAEALTADESTEQNERSMVSTEAEGEKESPVADASSAVEEAQQEATASLEAAQVQAVGEDLDVAAPSAHEDNIDSIQEGTASAAQEMPDQEAVEDESGQDSEASSATTRSQEIPKDS
ncbi:protein MGARP isoform X2 [Chelonoidis abingdonii]|uniref:protein MGARP isoform X2 n=1 Tax=Chelonoidis abingdonii TaxID=106734 RepID=UPI0013F25C62|nr:protein MGARP isoform X2 [Chelonoidis abingdonii]